MQDIIDDIKNNARKYLLRRTEKLLMYYETPFTDELGQKFNLKIATTQDEKRNNKVYIMSNRIKKNEMHGLENFIGLIGCIHIAVKSDFEENSNHKEFVESTEDNIEIKEEISTIEQFASMISYINGIVEMGIKQLLSIGYIDDEKSRPEGFNEVFLNQFLDAISKALTYSDYDKDFDKIRADWIYEILKPLMKNKEWFKERFELFAEKYKLEKLGFDQRILDIFDEFAEGTKYDINEIIESFKNKPKHSRI